MDVLIAIKRLGYQFGYFASGWTPKILQQAFNATKFAMLKLDESFVPEAIAKVFTIHSSC
jgi:hypothetical protein